MTRINKVRKAIKYITGKEVTGDFNTIGQLLDGFNKDCEENGLQIGGGDNTFIVSLTNNGADAPSGGVTKYNNLVMDKTPDEVAAAIDAGKNVIVRFRSHTDDDTSENWKYLYYRNYYHGYIFSGLYHKTNYMSDGSVAVEPVLYAFCIPSSSSNNLSLKSQRVSMVTS